ncbi:hypothetical protein [Streptomyces sp. NBC_01451]|uniref:hypothetical protein n=1 Tax=Streptomyces sp. NBC_01451 TaxID=2903872 RepID=UPI002E353553|nr:hypothetical protein [Streptomyces sp. NBC_01451]
MSSSSQHPAPASRNLAGAEAEDLALYREKFRGRLPESLDELHGPTDGVVELPLHVAWSGMTAYDMGSPRQRMGLANGDLWCAVFWKDMGGGSAYIKGTQPLCA